MSSLVYSQGLRGWRVSSHAMSQAEIVSSQFFRTIPPERVGLNGEYDHSGLAKRVDQAFRQEFQSSELERLSVTQRGRVVILTGWIADATLLERLTRLALEMSGAAAVEAFGVCFTSHAPRLDRP